MSKSHQQIAHIWANNPEAYLTGFNVFCRGGVIYSYGEHFPIARHIQHKGKRAVLFTTRSYSISTSGHISCVHQACRHLPVFHIGTDILAKQHSATIRKDYEQRIVSALLSASRARTRTAQYLHEAHALAREANACAQFFGWTWRLSADSADLADKIERQQQQAARKAARERKAARKHRQEQVCKFREGVPGYQIGRISGHALLRINPFNPENVETSQGANFPVAHAVKAWPLIQACRNSDRQWDRGTQDVRLGHFLVEYVTNCGDVKAGCHYVDYAECRLLAEQLGLI